MTPSPFVADAHGEGAGSGFGCEVRGTVAAEPVTDSDTRTREGSEQRLSGKCGGLRRLVDRTVGGHRAGGTVLQRVETAVQPTRPLARFGSLLLAWPAARLGLWRAVIRIG